MTKENSKSAPSSSPADDHAGHHQGAARHVPWQVHRNAFVWEGDEPIDINLHPVATDLRAWLSRKGQLQVFPIPADGAAESFSNPYTASASILAVAYAEILNETHAFGSADSDIDDLAAEVRRMRLHHEQALYTARVCEATIKQLLHCTAVPIRLYKKMALGQLLQQPCRDCRGHGRPKHNVSLIGTLAHRFGLCHEVDYCLDDHLKIVNRRRNADAAHATLGHFQPRPVRDARALTMATSVESANELLHMLQHISNIEQALIVDLTSALHMGFGSDWWKNENLA